MPLKKVNIHIPFTSTVPAATESTLTDSSPLDGSVTSIVTHFPDGCNALVSIVCYVKGNRVLPTNNTLALNNAIQEFAVNRPVSRGDTLQVVIANADGVNSHTPSIIFTLEGDYHGD